MSLTTHSGKSGFNSPRELRQLCCHSFWCGQDRVHALNLSNGGMCLRIDRRIEPGETVELHHGPQLRVKARVAWVRQLAACTEFGVQFLDNKQQIEQWTEYFQPAKAEPILALPAPEHSTRFMAPHFNITHNNQAGSGNSNFARSGKTWQTAWRIISDK